MKRLKPALMSVCMLAAMILAVFMPAGTAMAAADYSFIPRAAVYTAQHGGY